MQYPELSHRYQLLRPLGSGGMGEVFLVWDRITGRQCALKHLKALSRIHRRSLEQEFQTLATLRHPAIVSVYEWGMTPGGHPFFTMEYVPGVPADAAVQPGCWGALRVAGAEIAHGLEVLHSAGVLHGDLKPSNVLAVGASGPSESATFRLVDFGLSASLGDLASARRGSPGYTAPEVVRGEPMDVPSDLYALGATLHALACGSPPFQGLTVDELLRRQRNRPPEASALEDAGVPADLTQLILRLMAPEPGRRPGSARGVRREIERWVRADQPADVRRIQTAVVVGRTRELKMIETLLESDRRPNAVLVVGPAGIGKSALLSEAGQRAALAGHPVAHLTPGRLDGLLRGGAATDAAAALTRLLGGEGPLSQPRAPLFVVDDADALSERAQRAIGHLLLDPPPSFRTVWLMARSGMGDVERSLEWARVVSVCRLGPIDRSAVADLIGTRLREVPPAELQSFLWGRARGHPGQTVAALQMLVTRGALQETDAGLVIDRERLSSLAAEPAASRGRDSLAPAATDLLVALALAGEIEGSDLAVLFSGADRVLHELTELGLCRREAADRVRLSDPAGAPQILSGCRSEHLQRVAGRMLSLASLSERARVRVLLCGGRIDEAAEVAERDWERNADLESAVDVARQLEAVRPAESAGWYERVARHLFAEGRYEAAAPHLRRSIELDPSGPQMSKRLYLLSTASLRTGETEKTEQVLAELLSFELEPQALAKVLTNQCAHLRGVGRLSDAEGVGLRAAEVAGAAGDDESLAIASQMLALVFLTKGDLPAAHAACDRALAAFGRCGSVIGEIRTLGIQALLAQAGGGVERALEVYAAALARARSAGLRLATEELLINQSMVLAELGRWREVRRLNAEAARLALADHRLRNAANAYLNLAVADAALGNLSLARHEACAAVRLARRHYPAYESTGWRTLAQVHRFRGDLRSATRAARRAWRLSQRRGTNAERAWCRYEYGAVLERGSRLQQALHAWLEAAEECPTEQKNLKVLLRSRAAAVALRLGEPDRARSWMDLPSSDSPVSSPLAAAFAKEAQAHLRIEEGEYSEALKTAEEALGIFESMPAPAERARCIVVLSAHLHQARVFPELERVWLRWADTEYQRLGNRRDQVRALALLLENLEAERPEGDGRSGDDPLEVVSQLLTSLQDLKELSNKSMELVVQRLHAERGVFFVIEPESGRLHPVAEHGAVDAAVRRHAVGYSRRVVRRVAKSGGSLLITDAKHDPRANSDSVHRLQLRSILCVPLMTAGRVVGAIYLDDSRRTEAFGPEDQELLERMAQLLAIAIDRSYAHEAMKRTNEELLGENAELRQRATADASLYEPIGSSLAMRQIIPLVVRAAETQATILISGENGTGKEWIARWIHGKSARRSRPFVVLNCGALTDSLIESELFGILPNTATGVRGRPGRFREADGGTLLLDEIGEMPPRHQVALLSVLSSREVTPVGGGKATKVDVRIIAATNQDLAKLVETGRFRQDLFFRLNVLPISVPPLRERKADIPALVQRFASDAARAQGRDVPQFTNEFVARLMRAQWRGNVRQLRNTIERVMALDRGPKIGPRVLDADPEFGRRRADARGGLPAQLGELERDRIREALERCRGNQAAAARELGMLEQTLRYRMGKYGIRVQRRKARKRTALR